MDQACGFLCCWTFYVYSLHLLQHTYFDLEPAIHIWTGITVFLGIAFLLIDFFVEIVSDSFKNVLKRGYFDEFLATCKHVILVEVVTTFYLFTTQMGDIYSRISYYIMVPFYIVISYTARIIWKKILRKRGFHSTKKSILILAPEQMLEETLQTVSKSCLGYTRIVAAALDADLKGKTIAGISIVANHEEIIDFACSEWVDEVFIPPCNENDYPRELAATLWKWELQFTQELRKQAPSQQVVSR